MKSPKPAPAVAYSYLRYSSPRQSDGDSVRRQTTLRNRWLKARPHVRLDTTIRLEDRGVSGFTGTHRTNSKHALAQFCDLVERGRVPQGSYLIVENLDRLTREHLIQAASLVFALLTAGITVVQLEPWEKEYPPGMDERELLDMLSELARGHRESARKSQMLTEMWGEKKRLARDEKRPIGRSIPAWLELADGRFRIKPAAARAVKRIYQLAGDGLGVTAIVAQLVREGHEPISWGPRWCRSYVAKILSSRLVLGEYQPRKGREKRLPDGEPVEGYYPAVVTEAEWYRVQNTRSPRSRPGNRAPRSRHPLAGLLTDARDGSLYYVMSHPRMGKLWINQAAHEKRPGAIWSTFPRDLLSDAILDRLAELRSDELFADPSGGKIGQLTARLGEVERLLGIAVAKHEAEPENTTWAAQIDRHDAAKRKLVKELAEARAEAANPLTSSWAETLELLKSRHPERLRAALCRTVESIHLLIVKIPGGRLCAAQVRFPGGATREYLIRWAHRHRTVRPEDHDPVAVRTLATDGRAGGFDLRNPKDVAALEKLLCELDPDALAGDSEKPKGKSGRKAKEE